MEVGEHVAVDVGICAAGFGGGIEEQLLWGWYYISVLLASTGEVQYRREDTDPSVIGRVSFADEEY